jgi:hypothetical protein
MDFSDIFQYLNYTFPALPQRSPIGPAGRRTIRRRHPPSVSKSWVPPAPLPRPLKTRPHTRHCSLVRRGRQGWLPNTSHSVPARIGITHIRGALMIHPLTLRLRDNLTRTVCPSDISSPAIIYYCYTSSHIVCPGIYRPPGQKHSFACVSTSTFFYLATNVMSTLRNIHRKGCPPCNKKDLISHTQQRSINHGAVLHVP